MIVLRRLLPLWIGILVLQCAPVLPERSKPGGAARWAFDLSQRSAILWAQDAQLCRITGVGVGGEGWLPDRGGNWILSYWSPQFPEVLEVSVDSDGAVTTNNVPDSPDRGHVIPLDWKDSSAVWAATRSHRVGDVLSTFDAALAYNADAERFPDQIVWRIRFFLTQGGFETHILSPRGEWLALE